MLQGIITSIRQAVTSDRVTASADDDRQAGSSDGGDGPLDQAGLRTDGRGEPGTKTDDLDWYQAAVAERGDEPVDEATLFEALAGGREQAVGLTRVLSERTVDIAAGLDEDEFFRGVRGESTVVDRYDLEQTVPDERKRHFREVDRYWVNKPFSFAIVFHSERENELKYYVVEPYLTRVEEDVLEFLRQKLSSSIKYSWTPEAGDTPADRARVIERETYELLSRYDIYDPPGEDRGLLSTFGFGDDEPAVPSQADRGLYPSLDQLGDLAGGGARPEYAVADDSESRLTEYQVEKLLYYLRRDFVGYEHIDPIKHDVNVEDISCDGYDSPVFVYHSDYEQLITNLSHGGDSLDDFVIKLAQRSGKGISKRQPQVDATLPDGSRAQLTLGTEVSDRGTNYTIRQFKDVPYTPVDLINWHTFSLNQVAFLWLTIENGKSMLFAGGTASGKTTSLNALSLFIPANAKIVSIEDTREVELPQRNWVASVTRPSFASDDKGDVDEFDLLEAALRQRPDYIVMGEVRGEEGRTLFQMMSTGHTGYTTFHADSVGEVIDRFTTDPINVSKSLFTALDLVSIQAQTRVQGRKVRRSRSLTEINHYDAELDEVNVQDVYQWLPDRDAFELTAQPGLLDEIKFDRGWDEDRLQTELFKRQVVLAYLVDRGIDAYAEVAAAIQGFISDPETVLALIARDELDETLADLQRKESVHIDIDPEKEEMVPRPDPNDHALTRSAEVLGEANDHLLPQYTDVSVRDLERTLPDPRELDWNTGEITDETATPVTDADPDEAGRPVANGGERPDDWNTGDES